MASAVPQQSRSRASSYFSARVRERESSNETSKLKSSSISSAPVQPAARRSIATGECHQIDKKRQLLSTNAGGGAAAAGQLLSRPKQQKGAKNNKNNSNNMGQRQVEHTLQSDKMATKLGQALIKREANNKTPARHQVRATFRPNSWSSSSDNSKSNNRSKMLRISKNSHENDDSNKSEDEEDEEENGGDADDDDEHGVCPRNVHDDEGENDDDDDDDDEDVSENGARRRGSETTGPPDQQQVDQAAGKQHVGPVMGIFFKVWSLVKGRLGRKRARSASLAWSRDRRCCREISDTRGDMRAGNLISSTRRRNNNFFILSSLASAATSTNCVLIPTPVY